MNVKVSDLMIDNVMKVTPSTKLSRVRSVMRERHVGCMPVVGPEDEPLGVITATDLLADHADAAPVSSVMTKKVFTIPQYSDVSKAAHLMRKHHIHHAIVTHEKRVVGILSTFDLLALVEEHRFVMKNAPQPTKTKRRSGGRPETTI